MIEHTHIGSILKWNLAFLHAYQIHTYIISSNHWIAVRRREEKPDKLLILCTSCMAESYINFQLVCFFAVSSLLRKTGIGITEVHYTSPSIVMRTGTYFVLLIPVALLGDS